MANERVDDWVLDVTHTPYFVGRFAGWLFWTTSSAAMCPGKLCGVWHQDGTKAAQAWIAENPDWRERFA